MKRDLYLAIAFACALSPAACGGEDADACRAGYECDVHLAPPENGRQLLTGPFEVAQGTEALRCYWRRVDQDINVSSVEVAYNHGSHHLDVFQVDYQMPESDEAGFDCSKPEEWGNWPSQVGVGQFSPTNGFPRMLVGFQNERVSWRLPEGVAYEVKAGTQLFIQSHFVNAATQDTPTSRLLNFINFEAMSGEISASAETLFDEDMELELPPHATTTVTRYCEFPQQIQIIGMFAHFHSRGINFEISTYDPATQEVGEKPFYSNQSWSEPPWRTTDDWNGAVRTHGIKMDATYTNPKDEVIRWGSFVEVNEHMETYAMFFPRLDLDPAVVCHR
jgi:hypothetical protein